VSSIPGTNTVFEEQEIRHRERRDKERRLREKTDEEIEKTRR
jgi:hypothetical protein